MRECTEEKHTHLKYTGKRRLSLKEPVSIVPQWYTSSHLQVTINIVPKERKAVAGMERTQGSNLKLLYVQKLRGSLPNSSSGLQKIRPPEETASFYCSILTLALLLLE